MHESIPNEFCWKCRFYEHWTEYGVAYEDCAAGHMQDENGDERKIFFCRHRRFTRLPAMLRTGAGVTLKRTIGGWVDPETGYRFRRCEDKPRRWLGAKPGEMCVFGPTLTATVQRARNHYLVSLALEEAWDEAQARQDGATT